METEGLAGARVSPGGIEQKSMFGLLSVAETIFGKWPAQHSLFPTETRSTGQVVASGLQILQRGSLNDERSDVFVFSS